MEKIRAGSSLQQLTPSSGIPYATAGGSQASGHGGASSAVVADGGRRVTSYNIATFEKREKALPPDACTDKAPRAKFFQFPDRVTFYCAKCRKDGINSDTLAFDASHNIMMCVRCFERVVRPKKYRPSRVVPFPSLLSWLNYQPAPVMTSVSSDVMSRPAEAVAPSGSRVATEMLGGSRQTDIKALPATPMLATTLSASQHHGAAAQEDLTTHPCVRVWGRCAHGETCFFRNAPRDLCLAYLMGICQHGRATPNAPEPQGQPSTASSSEATTTCLHLHQSVADLPAAGVAAPPPRRAGDVHNAESGIALWIEKRRNSSNRIEWQLFRNGPLLPLLDQYVPEEAPPPEEARHSVSVKPEEEDGAAPSSVTLNISDITSALSFLK